MSTRITIGTQLVAPEGYRELEAGCIYYFLRSAQEQVLLVDFVLREPRIVVHQSEKRPTRTITPIPFPRVLSINRTDFETAIHHQIVRREEQHRMPPWLQALEGLDLALVDRVRPNAKRTHGERIDLKLTAINDLVVRADEVLGGDNLEQTINRHARGLTPAQNETRVRLWFFTYLLFGRNRFSLHYPIDKIGHWSRTAKTYPIKQGRPSHKGKNHGFNTDRAMLEKIDRGARREIGLGVTQTDMYVNNVRKDFGCRAMKVTRDGAECWEIWHPQGKPFPGFDAWRYHARKAIGATEFNRTLIGQIRMRSVYEPTRGSFTQGTWNLMQRVEADAYVCGRLPKGLIEGHPLPALRVVIKRDVASGRKTGIGFSQGSEDAVGYRMATFCEAIGMRKFCHLFGIETALEMGDDGGVSPADVHDRGAGAADDAMSRLEQFQPIVSEMAPSWAGQSKAVVESSHPRKKSNDERPGYQQSDLKTFELVREEIFKLLQFNQSSDASSRVPPDLMSVMMPPTPNVIWNRLSALGRTCAVEIGFEDAVRAFLEKRDAHLTRDGIELCGVRYNSPALFHEKVCETVPKGQQQTVQVYVLCACLRHIWLSWAGRIIELNMQFAVPVENEVLYMSLEDLKQYQVVDRQRALLLKEHRRAVNLQVRDEYKHDTGKEWNAAHRVAGRPKRGSTAARNEAKESRDMMGLKDAV